MTGTPPEVVARPEPEDPLAADRRTMAIGATAMVGLILVGVVSAQLFARGGCVDVPDPRAATDVDVDGEPADVAVDVLGADGDAMLAELERAAGAPVALAVPVGDATGLAPLDDGLVVTGPTVTSFDASLAPASTYTTDDVLVGDGATVFDVTVPNEVTGQTDAIVPLTGADLAVGTCVDTAVVGSPFAFLLDGAGGDLLVLRADEGGERPDLQLRTGGDGARWNQRIELPAGPPGTLAERFSARLGPDAVVAARRVGPQEEVEVPAVVALAREDGEERFTLAADALASATGLDPTDPLRWQVAAVGSTSALLHGRPDPADAEADTGAPADADGVLAVIELGSGDVVAAVTDVGPLAGAVHDVATAEDRYLVAATTADGDALLMVDGDGEVVVVDATVDRARLAWRGDTALAGGDGYLVRIDPAGEVAVVAELPGARVIEVDVTVDGRIVALIAGDASDDVVLAVTTPVDGLAVSAAGNGSS